ncbi:transposase [Azospirillum sp. TSH7]|uniref:IS5 family transposase n=1 Tax=unclassified Azospirillum TaxID=2630922 RepID=UPI000D607ED5|nr:MULTISPECIES: IS5 family transposase [unclassified Azospirillum]PWC60774.1 transposase [Azospirillum sp. TSH20]PWC67295.1 transposase [Azospirillum sp. TSH7]
MPYKANESRRHKIPKARYPVENWSNYDAALRRRGDLTIWVMPEAIATWTPPASGRRGRPARYSDVAIEAGLMLRLAFGRPWRQTEGLLSSLMRLLGLDLPVPDHTTFSRRSANLEVASALARTDGPVRVVIDSTGLKVFGTGEWHLEKHGGQARRSWRKLHLAIDPDTGEILASALTSNEEGDASLIGPLLDQIARPIGTVLADGAYDGEPIYQAVMGHTPDAAVVIPPRSTAVPSDTTETAPTQRDRHIRMIKERGRAGWQRAVDYGRRSLGEVAMLRYKTLIGRSLHARSLPRQKTEAKVACKVINIMTGFGMPVSRRAT